MILKQLHGSVPSMETDATLQGKNELIAELSAQVRAGKKLTADYKHSQYRTQFSCWIVAVLLVVAGGSFAVYFTMDPIIFSLVVAVAFVATSQLRSVWREYMRLDLEIFVKAEVATGRSELDAIRLYNQKLLESAYSD
jgi:uncharacterized membrane protein YjjP (DUF1212 family)